MVADVVGGDAFADLLSVLRPMGRYVTTLLDTFALSYPSRRYRSALIGIIVHSSQQVMVLALMLTLVLR